jgi:tripartite-type tricarboxylate transporter receptor subunit TctC
VISQFRAIVMRAGTDPKQVAVMAAAVEKAARSADYAQYLKDELAFEDSFIPAAQTAAFFDRELKLIEANMPKKS